PGRDLDEVDLDVLRQEGLVAGADAPPRARVLRVAGVADPGVVDDDLVVPDTRGRELGLAELPQSVLVGAHAPQEHTAFLCHPGSFPVDAVATVPQNVLPLAHDSRRPL